MTAKEMLKTKYVGNDEKGNLLLAYTSEQVDNIKQALTELEELKRYPTSDEVCEALGKLFGTEFRFIKNRFCFIHEGPTAHVLDSGVRVITIDMLIEKAPHLITLIGRFYEGLEKVGMEE